MSQEIIGRAALAARWRLGGTGGACERAVLVAAVLVSVFVVPRWVGADAGDVSRGQAAFAAKHCVRCHGQRDVTVGPALTDLRRPQGAYELAGRLWNHAPAMFTVLTHEGLAWPEISAAEMADLMAYLGADPTRDPAPNLLKGHAAVVSKGCLKCHTYRGEGSRAGPDLATLQADYAPAATWAAKMWRHTPRMAAKAMELGVSYPRFTGDEMVNLLAFLRTGASR